MKLTFDVARCIRAKSKFSSCEACVASSGYAVQIEENLPAFVKGTGLEAAGCVGACPTEAFGFEGYDTATFFFRFLEEGREVIEADEKLLPCVSLLSVEHLIALSLASDKPLTCNLFDYEGLKRQLISDRIEEANFILSSLTARTIAVGDFDTEVTEEGSEQALHVQDRRDFLRKNISLKGALKQKQAFDEAVEKGEWQKFGIAKSDIASIRQKIIPDKRKLLFTVLKHVPKPKTYDVLAQEDVSFVSQKYITDACTNCQMCHRICPTGALSSDAVSSFIAFDAMLCVKCRLCHDVCEPDAIKLQPGFETKEFFEPTQRTLAVFTIKRCFECGNPFTYTGGEQVCPRCQLEEEEAITLHRNAKEKQKKEE